MWSLTSIKRQVCLQILIHLLLTTVFIVWSIIKGYSLLFYTHRDTQQSSSPKAKITGLHALKWCCWWDRGHQRTRTGGGMDETDCILTVFESWGVKLSLSTSALVSYLVGRGYCSCTHGSKEDERVLLHRCNWIMHLPLVIGVFPCGAKYLRRVSRETRLLLILPTNWWWALGNMWSTLICGSTRWTGWWGLSHFPQ